MADMSDTLEKLATAAGVCKKCDQLHPKCIGHNRRGGPCGLNPLANQRVCKLHGGASPAALEGAARREVELRARKALRQRWAEGAEVAVEDPLTELARLAGEVVAFKDYLRDQVDKLDGTLTYWQEKEYLDGDGETEWTKAAEEVRAVVAAYERAQDRAAKVLANIVKLDLAGRMLELNQAKADIIVTAVREGMATVDMDAAVRHAVQEAIAEKLAALGRQPLELEAG